MKKNIFTLSIALVMTLAGNAQGFVVPSIPQVATNEISKPASKQGVIETFTYTAHVEGQTVEKRAQVYVPYGYKAKDKKTKYDVLYLIHGGGDNITSFLTPPNKWFALRDVLDHLIEEGKMRPIIVVCPTFYNDVKNAPHALDATAMTRNFHTEFQNDLVPAVENVYNTYLQGKDSVAVTRSRSHRYFGGFSMGALTTWFQLTYGINAVKTFIPLSGDIWVFDAQGKRQDAKTSAEWINGMIASSPFAKDFEVYGYTGTKDIAGNPMKLLIEALNKYAPLFRYSGKDANLRFAMREEGQHFYGNINEYLYLYLPLIFKP